MVFNFYIDFYYAIFTSLRFPFLITKRLFDGSTHDLHWKLEPKWHHQLFWNPVFAIFGTHTPQWDSYLCWEGKFGKLGDFKWESYTLHVLAKRVKWMFGMFSTMSTGALGRCSWLGTGGYLFTPGLVLGQEIRTGGCYLVIALCGNCCQFTSPTTY